MEVLKNRKWLAALLGIVILAGAGAAAAFWSGSGTGTGPGVTVPVTFKAANATTSPIRVASVHLVSVAVDAGHSACVTSDFTMPDVTQGFEVPAGATAAGLPTNGQLAYADSAVSQDACKGATITLTLSSV